MQPETKLITKQHNFMKRNITLLVALVAAWVLAVNVQAQILFHSSSTRWIGDGSSAKISWKITSGEWNYFRLMVSESEEYDNPEYWKNVYTTTNTEQIVSGLAVDHTYYVHLQGGVDADNIDPEVFTYKFYAKRNIGACGLYFHLRDSYGDGWDEGAKIVIEQGGEKTEITLQQGKEAWAEYISNMENATMTWHSGGSYDNEISFDIYSGDGRWNIEVKNARTQLTDGQKLMSGNLCYFPCSQTVTNIDFTSNANKTEYTVTWSGTADAYEVAAVQKYAPTDEELENAAKVVTSKKYIVAGKANAVQHVYIRSICSDGEKGPWAHKVICDPANISAKEEVLPQVAKNIKLPYTEKGAYMANAVGLGTGKTDFVTTVPYRLSLAAPTDVMLSYASVEKEYTHVFVLYKDPGEGKPLEYVDEFQSGTHPLQAGDYYILLVTNKGDDYKVRISKASEPSFQDIRSLNFYAEGDFTKEQDFICPTGWTVPAKLFRYKPSKDQEIYMQLNSSNTNKGAVVAGLYKDGYAPTDLEILVNAQEGQTYTLIGGTTYYFAIYPQLGYKASATDDCQFLLAAKTSEPVKTKLITLDAHITDATNKDDFLSDKETIGKVYEFVLEEDAKIAFSLELLGAHAQDPLYMKGTRILIYKDNMEGSEIDYWLAANEFYGSADLTGTPSGTHYYVVVMNIYGVNTQYRLDLRLMTPANDIKGKRIEMNTGHQSSLSALDPYRGNSEGLGANYSNADGSVEYYTVPMEAGKRYQITMHKLIPTDLDNCAITVLDPEKTGTFAMRTVASTKEIQEDNWLLLEYTPSHSADYTLVFGSVRTTSNLKDSLSYEFGVNQVREKANVDAIKVPADQLPYQNNGVFSGNNEVLPNTTYHFQEGGDTWIKKNGAYDVLPLLVTVHSEDSLWVEFGGDEDVSIYIWSGANSTPTIVNDVPYAYPYEKYGLKNTTSSDRNYVIFCSYNMPLVQAHPYYVRVANTADAFTPEVVTAKLNKNSVTISNDGGIGEAQAALEKLVIRIFNNKSITIGTIPNHGDMWKVNLDNNTATYELNESDLPLGMVFAQPQTMRASIIRSSVDIEEVEISSDREGEVRKVLRNGIIMIDTPYGTFDLMGRKVK